ncbi:MAG: outer membrane lipoprotein-sorting protein [Armatimonadetes bacterium]|nr:outer membrane lipoprotein-sorting protein [Armatimonadota bacterium]
MKNYLLALVLVPLMAFVALGAEKLDGQEIINRANLAFHYSGQDMVARVEMRLVDGGGQTRERSLSMLRKNLQKGGEQGYFIYFHKPADVKEMTFLVHKFPDRDDSRWLFLPAINMVRRIAANDRHSSFVGSDFTYEDVSGRDPSADVHRLLREESLGGRGCFVVESTPREDADYARKLSWIDRENFLPLREEYFDAQNALYRVFTADEVKSVQGLPSILRQTMANVKSAHRTTVVYSDLKYNVGLEDKIFSEGSLRRAPRKWLQ